jgi:hypothetical protein
MLIINGELTASFDFPRELKALSELMGRPDTLDEFNMAYEKLVCKLAEAMALARSLAGTQVEYVKQLRGEVKAEEWVN